MIASRARPGRRRRPRLRRRRGRRRRACSVHATPGTLAGLRVGEEARLATSLVVREDSLTLFGFADDDERAVFELVQTVTGVGPRLAQAMLAVHAPDGAARAPSPPSDLAALTKVPGIGRKGAAAARAGAQGPARRRRPATAGAAAAAADGADRPWRDQVREALVGLGWSGQAGRRRASTRSPAADGRRRRRRRRRRCCARRCGCWGARERDRRARTTRRRPARRPASSTPAATSRSARSRRRCARAARASSSASAGSASSSSLVLEAAKRRGAPPDHVLLSGPPGLGKTTLAMIIAAELDAPLRITSGPAIQHAGDLAAILSSLAEGEVLFLDEIHRMSRPAEEMLYMAMEDFRVDVVVGKGPGATAIPLEIPPFTLVGATTRAGLLPGAAARPVRLHRPPGLLRRRPSSSTIAAPLGRPARRRRSTTDGGREIAGRSRGTPRIANRLLRRVRDCAAGARRRRRRPGAARAALDAVRRRRARPGPARPGRARGAVPAVRRRSGRPVDARGRGRRGDRDGRDGGRAVPGARGPAGPHPARPGRHPGGLGAPRAPGPRGRCSARADDLTDGRRLRPAATAATGQRRVGRPALVIVRAS